VNQLETSVSYFVFDPKNKHKNSVNQDFNKKHLEYGNRDNEKEVWDLFSGYARK